MVLHNSIGSVISYQCQMVRYHLSSVRWWLPMSARLCLSLEYLRSVPHFVPHTDHYHGSLLDLELEIWTKLSSQRFCQRVEVDEVPYTTDIESNYEANKLIYKLSNGCILQLENSSITINRADWYPREHQVLGIVLPWNMLPLSSNLMMSQCRDWIGSGRLVNRGIGNYSLNFHAWKRVRGRPQPVVPVVIWSEDKVESNEPDRSLDIVAMIVRIGTWLRGERGRSARLVNFWLTFLVEI
jgi:hypothetical protein